jgi:hypothetical protein
MPTNANTPPTPDLAALQQLGDAELSAIAQNEMSAGDVTRLQWLLEENADNALTGSERAELAARLAAAEQFAQRREHAAAILAGRRPPTSI